MKLQIHSKRKRFREATAVPRLSSAYHPVLILFQSNFLKKAHVVRLLISDSPFLEPF